MRILSFSADRADDDNTMETASVSPPPLNCPKCPRRMEYLTSPADGILYRCVDHGGWQLGPGDLRPSRKNNPPTQPDITL